MPSELRTTSSTEQPASGPDGSDGIGTEIFRRPALLVLLPFGAGLIAGAYLPVHEAASFVGAVGLAFLAFLSRSYRTAALVCLIGAAFLAGATRIAQYDSHKVPESVLAPVLDANVTATGRVVTDPQLDGRRWRYGLLADTVRHDSIALVGHIRVRVHADSSLEAVQYGDRVTLRGILRRPHPTTPGLFDYTRYLERSGYAALLSVFDEDGVKPHGEPRTADAHLVSGVRDYVRQSVTARLNPVQSGLMRALVLGERAGIPREVRDAFQTSGVIHVLAVSGLHVGIVLLGIGWPLRRLLGRIGAFGALRWVPVPLIAVTWAYAALTGMNPPVVRASIMATVFLLAWPVRRVYDPWNALALSGLITLAISPADLFGASFQLSYTAMAGILWLAGAIRKHPAFARFVRAGYSFRARATKYALGLIAMTIAAQVATWPVTAHHFGRVSLVGVLLSPVVVVLVTIAVWGGMLSVAVGWIPGVAYLIAPVVGSALNAALALTGTTASLPFAATAVRPPEWYEIALYFAALFVAYRVGTRRTWWKGAVVGTLLLANLAAWSHWAHRRTATEIAFLDVGQGDAVVCAFRNGTTLLVDGGRRTEWFDAGDWVVAPFLRSRGITHLDAVIATHADNDHIGGLVSVLEEIDTGMLLYNGFTDSSRAFTDLMAVAREREIPVHAVSAGDTLAGFGARVHILGPATAKLQHDNDRSVIVRIDADGHTLLLTGDAAIAAECGLVRRYGEELRSDVLKLGHHGSASSTSETLLGAVQPSIGVVSAGLNNRYGHPAPKVVERVAERGIDVLRTDSSGTLIWHIGADTTYWVRTLTRPDLGSLR